MFSFKIHQKFYLFLIQCHKLKESNAKITQAFKTFKTLNRIGLSGTILQNNLMEFWCLMDWLMTDTEKKDNLNS
jgi:SNF2 family DNA or RNA helicase